MADSKATKAARDAAAKEGVDPGTLEGSGKDGTVTKQDVEEALTPEAPEKKVRLKVNASSTVGGARGPDGILYARGDEVDESYFNQVLSGAKNGQGRPMFSAESVESEGGEA